MPYVSCPSCQLTTYTAACHSTTDCCPRCERPISSAACFARPFATLVAPLSGRLERRTVPVWR